MSTINVEPWLKRECLLSGATKILDPWSLFLKLLYQVHLLKIDTAGLDWPLNGDSPKIITRTPKIQGSNKIRLLSESKSNKIYGSFKHVLSILCGLVWSGCTILNLSSWAVSILFDLSQKLSPYKHCTWFSFLIMSLGLWDDQTIPLWQHCNTILLKTN